MEAKAMDFRKIETSELETVVDLLDASFPIGRERIARDLKEILKNPRANGTVYGLWLEGVLIGTATYGALYGVPSSQPDATAWQGEGLMRYLAIHKGYQRKGYATMIIKKAIADLKKESSPFLCVAVLAEYEIGVRLFEKLGFQYYETFETDVYGTHQTYVLWFK